MASEGRSWIKPLIWSGVFIAVAAFLLVLWVANSFRVGPGKQENVTYQVGPADPALYGFVDELVSAGKVRGFEVDKSRNPSTSSAPHIAHFRQKSAEDEMVCELLEGRPLNCTVYGSPGATCGSESSAMQGLLLEVRRRHPKVTVSCQ